MTSRRKQAIKLRKTGLSYAEIGRRWSISRERARQLAAPEKPATGDVALTYRGQQILALVAQGYTTKGIAAVLSTSPYTVKSQISHMMKKLGLKNRTQLVLAFLHTTMNLKKLEIINQLEADMNHLGDSEGHSYARLNIKAAMRDIEDDNYRFACDRLGIAMTYILNGRTSTGE